MSNEAVEFIEIDIPVCSLTYGVAPCTASLVSSPPTGTDKCLNCESTCQDLVNFDPQTVTLRFAKPATYLPRDIDIVSPNIVSIDFSPAIVSRGESPGQRASFKVTLLDHPHSDTGGGFDKYHAERTYNPYEQGTLWGKFKARFPDPTLRGAALRYKIGFVGQTLDEMETYYFFIESFDGPGGDGRFSFTAKDALTFLQDDRAQAPRLSNGFLNAAIDEDDAEATLSPSGVGDLEYGASGYINIGGNEVAYYTRDPYTKLLLEFNGSDGATSTADVKVANPHAVTFFGSAQLDTAQFKFGTASLLLGAAANYVRMADSLDWFLGTGAFTIDCHLRFTTVPSGAPNGTFDNLIFFQEQDGSNRLVAYFDGTVIGFLFQSGGVTLASYQATHAMSNATWHHFRFVRSGTSFFIFKDGVALSLTTLTAIASNSLANLSASLTIGGGGGSVAGVDWIDNFRWRKGVADTTSGFTPPAAEYELTGSGDVLRLVRAQFGTEASAHDEQDRVQLCLRYEAEDAADIIADLIDGYTDLDSSYIPLSTWQDETANYLGRVYTTIITEPTPVRQLVAEVLNQAALSMWDDNRNQQLMLQVLRAIPIDALTYDSANIIDGSFSSSEQPDKRYTQVWVYYGQKDPTKRVDDPDNYRSVARAGDEDAPFPSVLRVFARWIPPFSDAGDRLGAILLARFESAPRKFSIDLFRRNVVAPVLGSGYQLGFTTLQDALGAADLVPSQAIRLLPTPDRYRLDLEEFRFNAPAEDLTVRRLTIQSNVNDFNLKDAHDAAYPPIEPGQSVELTINAAVIVGSTSTAIPALDVGTWSGSPSISIFNNGRIQGRGGNAGAGAPAPGGSATAGAVGGPALYTRQAISLTDTSGESWGGGGGGGGGGRSGGHGGDGGGGGAGQLPGLGGAGGGGVSSTGTAGSDGTTEAGGLRGTAGNAGEGGNGGGPGLVGAAGSGSASAAGGAPGLAIDGISFVTTIGSPGDRRGGTAN